MVMSLRKKNDHPLFIGTRHLITFPEIVERLRKAICTAIFQDLNREDEGPLSDAWLSVLSFADCPDEKFADCRGGLTDLFE